MRRWVIGEKECVDTDSILLHPDAIPLSVRTEARAYRKDGSWVSSNSDGGAIRIYDTQPVVRAEYSYFVRFMVPQDLEDVEVKV
jgi:hypothetical protein